jgi:very-short-patch-repair endonuclease
LSPVIIALRVLGGQLRLNQLRWSTRPLTPSPLMGEGWGGGGEKIGDRTTNISRVLRKGATNAENRLWFHLRDKHLQGIKFRRQEPIGKYIVDFVAFEKRLVIEIDGGQHAEEDEKEKDGRRDEWLVSQGFRVLRFWNNEVLQNLEGVLETIRHNCLHHPPLTPPIKGGEED